MKVYIVATYSNNMWFEGKMTLTFSLKPPAYRKAKRAAEIFFTNPDVVKVQIHWGNNKNSSSCIHERDYEAGLWFHYYQKLKTNYLLKKELSHDEDVKRRN